MCWLDLSVSIGLGVIPREKKGYVALKLDMSKAYDRVEWPYLKAIMTRMGFPAQLVNLIMRCVSSVSYSFILNNSVFGKIVPSRGLRQGDPLSPFLFVMCAQGISSMLEALERNRSFCGIPIDPGRLAVSHLFFADDSLVFFKATREGCHNIKQCLMMYERASGQMINFDKSAATFSPSISQQDANMVRQMLNINVVQGHAIYLGLPTFSIRKKRIQFGYIRDRVQHKVTEWKNKAFSAGGKETLLKSVVQAIPTYAMSCFRIPESICADINRMCASFWWGDANDQKCMHWAKWEALCRPKERGGIGFRDIRSFNKALLAKQVWRMIHNPTSLAAKVFKARYFKGRDIMTAEVNSAASFVWRSLAWSRSLLEKGTYWTVGDGQSIRAYKDAWIPTVTKGTLSKRVNNWNEIKVANLINSEGNWDQQKMETQCWPYEVVAIEAVKIGGQNQMDKRVWKYEENGQYSVKSGYLAQIGYYNPHENATSHDTKKWQSLIWCLKIPPKVNIFMWRAVKGFIPVEKNLLRHHVPSNGICYFCRRHVASTEHCLFFCERSRTCWKESRFWNLLKNCKQKEFSEIAMYLRDKLETDEFEVWVILAWLTWHFLCKLKHDKREKLELVNEGQGWLYWQVYQESRSAVFTGYFLGVQPGEKLWKPPERGMFRVDVDAMFNLSRMKFGAGVIVRNSEGKVIVALAKTLNAPRTALHAELMAVLAGIELCKKENINPFVLFTDSLLTVRITAGLTEDSEGYSEEVKQVRAEMDSGAVQNISHAYRSATMAAHFLAHSTLNCSIERVWKSDFTQWLMSVVNDDGI